MHTGVQSTVLCPHLKQRGSLGDFHLIWNRDVPQSLSVPHQLRGAARERVVWLAVIDAQSLTQLKRGLEVVVCPRQSTEDSTSFL